MPINKAEDIGTGLMFPPERERQRVEVMERYARYSDRRYAGLNAENADNLRLRPNIFRWLMNFWRDAVISDAPVVRYEGNDRINELIEAIRPSLMEATGLVIADLVRYGTGVYVNRRPMLVNVVDPRYWYPVRAPDDNDEGIVDVIAYPFASGNQRAQNVSGTAERSFQPSNTPPAWDTLTKPGDFGLFPDSLSMTVFDGEGGAVKRIYRFEGRTVGEQEGEQVTLPAGAPAVVSVREGDGFYGTSDFADILEYVAELHRRESSVSLALDRHAHPHLAVPEGVLQTDANGRFIVRNDGMVIPVPEGSRAPEYVQWDANYEAQESSIMRASDRVLRFTAIAPVLVNAERGTTRALPSGAALRRLAIPTVNRIRNLRAKLTEAMRDVIVGQVELIARSGGERYAIEREKISFRWPPELSGGITDEADAITLLVESGIMERETAIQLLSKVNRSEAEDIAEGSQEETARQARPDPQRPVPDRTG